MKAKDLMKLDLDALNVKLKELRALYSKEYVNSKIGSKTEKAISTRNIKKDIARVLTVINLKKNKK